MRLSHSAFLAISVTVYGAAVASGELSIEPNRGQSGADVRYLARTPHGVIFFLDRELVLSRGGDVRLELLGSDPRAPFAALEPRVETTSYFVGRDRSRWAQAVPNYARLARHGVYPGIDAVFYGTGGKLEYDFVISPHADPSQIRLAIRGARQVQQDRAGDLVIKTPEGIIRQRKPILYQVLPNGQRRAVTGEFHRIRRDTFGFTVGPYDPSLALTIDPVIESSTYLGFSGDESIVASDGKISIGTASSAGFPLQGAGSRRGLDIIVRGIGGAGIYVFGGSGNDVVTAAYLPPYLHFENGLENIVIVGYSDSPDLPTDLSLNLHGRIVFPWQPDYGGGATDAFVLSISPQASFSLPFTPFLSYLGGTGDDQATGVSVLGSYARIVGTTNQPQFPVLGSATVSTLGPGGGLDGFIAGASFFPGAELFGLTYFGGSGDDRPLGVEYSAGGTLITGVTNSPDFPSVTQTNAGGHDTFVLKADNDLRTLHITASTVFGGSGDDKGVQVLTLPNGNVLVGGVTTSPDFPLLNAAQATYGGGISDIFLTQFSPDLTTLLSSTYYGGSGADNLTALLLDQVGNLFAGGYTTSRDFPVRNAVQPVFGGGSEDGFLLHFEPGGSLHQATYLGGSGNDRILGLSTFGDLTIIASGQTASADFPIAKPAQPKLVGNSSGFVTQISTNLIGVAELLIGGKDLRVSTPVSVGILNGSSSAAILVTSSDPTVVVVSRSYDELPGAASVTLTGGGAFAYDCLTDTGRADLTFSAPGYPTRVAQVECYPPTLQLGFSSYYFAPLDPFNETIPLWSRDRQLEAYLYAARPDGSAGSVNVDLRPGVDPIQAHLESSNPAVGTVSSSDTIFQRGLPVGRFSPVAIGDTTLTLVSTRTMGRPVNAHVRSSLETGIFATDPIPTGFSCRFNVSGVIHGPEGKSPIHVTSLNPDRILLTRNPLVKGATTLAIEPEPDSSGYFYLQAAGPAGSAAISVAVEGLDPITVPLTVTQPAVSVYLRSTPQLHIGDVSTVFVTVGIALHAGCSSNTAEPVHLAIVNSNPDAVSAPSSVDLAGVDDSFQVKSVGTGMAVISVVPPSGFAAVPASGVVTFSSRPKP